MTSHVLQKAIKAHEDFVAVHPANFRLWLPLWRLIARGKPVAPEELVTASHRPLHEIQAELQSLDVRLDQAGHILASGLSLVPTVHQFYLGEKTLYTWCALDTLALPVLLGRTARVISSCPVTGREIRLTVTLQGIEDLDPAGAVVSVRLPGEDTEICHVQEDICNDGFFFVSHEVASTWPSQHQSAVLLSVEEAAQLGRDFARQMLALPQEPDGHG